MIEIGPNLKDALTVIAVCLAVIALFVAMAWEMKG